MPSAVMSIDANQSAPPARTLSARPVRVRGWDGLEPEWVTAAWAAAPWPVWAGAIWLVGPDAAAWLHGPLALSLVLAAMVLWSARPSWRSVARWVPSIVGTGLMGELLANALTDMGQTAGFSSLSDPARAIGTWALCVGLYEVTPILAAASRITRTERRTWSLDLPAHAVFAGLAVVAYGADPVHGELWTLSPWLAAAVALPLAAARACPPRTARTPEHNVRGGVLWGLAFVGWGLGIAMAIASRGAVEASLHAMRWGVSPAEGVLLALPALAATLGLAASARLLARGVAVRRAPSGEVVELGERSVTLRVAGADQLLWVAIDAGEMPREGDAVTLMGAEARSREGGPFRDGVASWSARRAFAGDPAAIARALFRRAGGWAAWAALSAIGLLMLLW